MILNEMMMMVMLLVVLVDAVCNEEEVINIGERRERERDTYKKGNYDKEKEMMQFTFFFLSLIHTSFSASEQSPLPASCTR